MDISSTPPVTIMFIPRILSTPSAWPPVAWLSPIATRGLSAITSPCRVVGISSWEFAGSAQLSSRVTLAYPPQGVGWDLTPGELLDTSVCQPLNPRWRDRDFIMGICLLEQTLIHDYLVLSSAGVLGDLPHVHSAVAHVWGIILRLWVLPTGPSYKPTAET